MTQHLHAASISGIPNIIDGDTLRFDIDVRLLGIDAPETAQSCRDTKNRNIRCGIQSTKALKQLIGSRSVRCEGEGLDMFDRLLATCFNHRGENINRIMVQQGWAVAFIKYDKTYWDEEKEAKTAQRGWWSTQFQRPVDFRAKRWESTAKQQDLPDPDCPIKGNINSKGIKIYHMPYSRHFNKTRINVKKGERYFCDEQEAIAAGWRAPRTR